MIIEAIIEISSIASGYGGVTVVVNPEAEIFRINLDWIEMAIAVTVYGYISNKAFRHVVRPVIEVILSGWRRLRAIEWRL